MAILWTNDLATGNGQIDSEHKQLIKAASELMFLPISFSPPRGIIFNFAAIIYSILL